MASTEEVIQRLKESRPPATDPFTYLTIIEKSLSPEILPTLEEILEDGELTNDIGWDMVEMLISVPESENCLELIARLGNPREVILKVLEVMEKTSEESEAGAEGSSKKFITLLRMLTILHRRLQVKAPSRFLQPTLQTVYQAYYSQGAETTAAVIDLVRSLTPQKRPPLPTRQSSTKLDAPFRESDMSKSAPDPEADQSGQLSPGEGDLVNRLLQSFITCIIEAYVNTNSMEWSARLLEYCEPERVVPRRKSTMQAFKEVEELQARDALVGQLVVCSTSPFLFVVILSPNTIIDYCRRSWVVDWLFCQGQGVIRSSLHQESTRCRAGLAASREHQIVDQWLLVLRGLSNVCI